MCVFSIILLLSVILGLFVFDGDFNRYSDGGYSDIITFLSIVFGFEIASLSIIFNSPIKKKLYDTANKQHQTELHRLRDYYRFSIYFDIISILLLFIIPEFSFSIPCSITIHKSIIVLPILFCSVYCVIKACNDLFRIFVFPTNER